MITLPETSIHDPSIVPALRELISQHPAATRVGSETLARMLWVLRYLPYRPETFQVEAAREVLLVDEEVLA